MKVSYISSARPLLLATRRRRAPRRTCSAVSRGSCETTAGTRTRSGGREEALDGGAARPRRVVRERLGTIGVARAETGDLGGVEELERSLELARLTARQSPFGPFSTLEASKPDSGTSRARSLCMRRVGGPRNASVISGDSLAPGRTAIPGLLVRPCATMRAGTPRNFREVEAGNPHRMELAARSYAGGSGSTAAPCGRRRRASGRSSSPVLPGILRRSSRRSRSQLEQLRGRERSEGAEMVEELPLLVGRLGARAAFGRARRPRDRR